MIGTLAVLLTTGTFNEKAIDLLSSAGSGKAILCSEKYAHDSDFYQVVANTQDSVSFQYVFGNQNQTQQNQNWFCSSRPQREALKKELVTKLISSGGTYDVSTLYSYGTDNRSTNPLTTNVWREVINLYRRIEGHRSNFTYISITIDYQLGIITSGRSVFASKPVHLKPGFTAKFIQQTIEKDGKPDQTVQKKIWYPYAMFYPFDKSAQHKRELYLATVVNVLRNNKWTTYLFNEAGEVQVNPIGLIVI